MEKVNFTLLDLSKLSNEDVAALISKTTENATSVSATIGEVPNVILVEMQLKNQAFSAQVNRLRKSMLTDPITIQRTICSNLHSEIKRGITYESKSRIATRKAAAEKLTYFIAPFKDLSKKPLATQQESTDEMIEKYSADVLIIEAATTLGITNLFDELKISNTELKKLFDNRNIEIGGRTESGSELRSPAVEAYRDFCISMELAATYTANQDITNLFNQMNEVRKKYHAMLPTDETITDEEIEEVDTEV